MAVSVYEIVTNKIIEKLENGTVPWQQSWSNASFPRNITGREYRGINVFLLGMQGYRSPYWLTWKQANAIGDGIKEDQRKQYTIVIFWNMVKDKRDKDKVIPLLRYYRVWNYEQTVGVPEPVGGAFPNVASILKPDERHNAAQSIVDGFTDAPTIQEAGDAAWYRPASDLVNVPPRGSFTNLDAFYSTLFHELGHSTGAKKRLNRPMGTTFGSHAYGREELVAEMVAAFLNAESGIEATMDNSAAYLRSWVKTISEDTRAVVVAAGQAQKATDYILGRTPVNEPTED